VEFPGGESYARLRGRVDAAVADLRVAHAGRAVAVVTHGGPIRAALASCLDMPAAAIFRLGQDYGGLSVVEWFADEPVVRCVNAPG
jgi:broad specificity phosphatase PhoE